jgi:Na+/proline symporter
MAEALDAGHITAIGVGVIVGLVLLGVLLSLVVTALVGRLIILAAVVVLAIIVWQQRGKIEDNISAHNCNLTFFGVHLDPPDSLAKYCK